MVLQYARPNKQYRTKEILLYYQFFTIIKIKNYILYAYYGPSVISVTITKGGHPRGSRLYGTSGTIGREVAELYRYIYAERTYILIYLRPKRTDVLIYSTITIGRSYIFKYIVPTVR